MGKKSSESLVWYHLLAFNSHLIQQWCCSLQLSYLVVFCASKCSGPFFQSVKGSLLFIKKYLLPLWWVLCEHWCMGLRCLEAFIHRGGWRRMTTDSAWFWIWRCFHLFGHFAILSNHFIMVLFGCLCSLDGWILYIVDWDWFSLFIVDYI